MNNFHIALNKLSFIFFFYKLEIIVASIKQIGTIYIRRLTVHGNSRIINFDNGGYVDDETI